MTLFEIELDPKFKIENDSAFLDYKEFEEYYHLNNLSNNQEDDFTNYITKEFLYTSCLGIEKGNFGETGNSFDTLVKHIKSGIKQENKQSTTTPLYPEWLLFFIAIKKINNLSKFEYKFLKYIDIFNYICNLRNKKYIIRNIKSFLFIHEYLKADEYKEELNTIYLETLDTSVFSTEFLYEFLRFLYFSLYVKFKKQEKYKLMWNIEVYIVETIILLKDKSHSFEKIYKEIGGGTYSELHNIFKYYPLYIKESNKHFNNIFLPKIKDIFKNLHFEDTINYLTMYENYENIIMSYLEVHRRFNADKKFNNEIIMGAMVRNMLLEVEEKLRDSLINPPKNLNKCLEKLDINNKLFDSIRGKHKTNKQLLTQINNIIITKEDSLEKYFAIYYNSRNYLAHYNIDMDKFFWGDDGERHIISNVLDSVMIILYRIEVIKKVENES